MIGLLLLGACSSDSSDQPDLRADFDSQVEYETPKVLRHGLGRSRTGTTSDEASPTISPSDALAFAAGEVTLTVRRGAESDSVTKKIQIVEC